jgi:hypothetical protein
MGVRVPGVFQHRRAAQLSGLILSPRAGTSARRSATACASRSTGLLLQGAPAYDDGEAVAGLHDNAFAPSITATNLADAIGQRPLSRRQRVARTLLVASI